MKAVFFDRDGTLTKNDKAWEQLRRDKFLEWSGVELDESYEFFMKIFQKVMNGGFSFAPYKNVEEELQFFKQWFLYAFKEYKITEKVQERADYLTNHLWYLKKELYPETIEVLTYFKNKGLRMGVISDGPPSLELTLKNCGIHDYFCTFTASSFVGVGKPNEKIYNVALTSLKVKASECLYIDDAREEAEGARKLGFHSFWLDRTGNEKGQWVTHNLRGLIDYFESNQHNN